MGYFLFLLFTVSYFLHLTSRIPALGFARFDLILMALIGLVIFLSRPGARADHERFNTTNRLLWLIGMILLSLPLVEWPGSVIRFGLENYAKAAAFFFFMVALVDTEKKLKEFMWVFILCQTFRVIEPAYLHITTGYWGNRAYSMVGGTQSVLNRLSGAPHDVVNANQLAWLIVSMIPFIFYLGWRRSTVLKLAALATAPIFLNVLLLTGSRSGLLSLAAVVIAMILLEKNKFRGLVIGGVLIATLGMLIAGELSSDLKVRYLSTFDRNLTGGDTAQGRIKGIEQDLPTILNRPFFGHGLGTSKEVSANFLEGRAQPAHNLYVEILQELGVVGFILFMLYIKEIVSSLSQAKRMLTESSNDHSWLGGLITATQAWIVMDLFYSLSCFGLSSWEWYLFGGISTVCLKLARERASDVAVGEPAQTLKRAYFKPAYGPDKGIAGLPQGDR